jgi:hypothetical protein
MRSNQRASEDSISYPYHLKIIILKIQLCYPAVVKHSEAVPQKPIPKKGRRNMTVSNAELAEASASTNVGLGGVLGAPLIGLAFIFPSFLMVVAISLAYVAYGYVGSQDLSD